MNKQMPPGAEKETVKISVKVNVLRRHLGLDIDIEDIYCMSTYRYLALGALNGPVMPYVARR